MKLLKILSSAKKNSDLDKPETTLNRSKIIQKKVFLRNIYKEFYTKIYSSLSSINQKGYLVELGSGAGFIKTIIPNIITSDILKLENIDMKFSALDMPFKNKSVNAFVMIDVLHHINNLEQFFKEANRSLKIGGQIIMIEPANTIFGGFIYKYFHHEPYNPKGGWIFLTSGPLSGANSALPWIVFLRDRKRFEQKYPNLIIQEIKPHSPLKYLLSGGFSLRQLLPNSFYPLVCLLETLLTPLNSYIGLFYTIIIEKV